MTSFSETPFMGLVTGFLKASFFGLVMVIAIGFGVAAAAVYPDPQAAGYAGISAMLFLMLASAGLLLYKVVFRP